MERATRYDAIVATLIGISALFVSGYTAYIQRQQVRAQVFPIVQLGSGSSAQELHVILSNKGTGPALIRDVLISVDGQPIHNWVELVERALGARQDEGVGFSSFGRSVVAAGEQLRVFSFSCAPSSKQKPATNEPADPKAPATFMPVDARCARLMTVIRRLSIAICYCSTLDECSIFSDGPGRAPSTIEARRCPAPSADSFN